MKGCFSRIIDHGFFNYILAICFALFFTETWGNGLRIKGNAYPINNRSAAAISFGQIKGLESFNKGTFQLSFNLALDEKSNQGGIFKLNFVNSEQAISMNLRSIRGDKIEFSLNLEGSSSLGHLVFDKSQLKIQQWFSVNLHIDLSRKKLLWKVLDQSIVLSEITGLKANAAPLQLIFGKNGYAIDVADYTIKDIYLSGGDVHCSIPLKERQGDIIHDSRGNAIGKVLNANWMATESFFWEKWKTIKLKSIGGYQIDQRGGRLIVFSQDSLRTIDLYSGKESVHPMPHNLPLRIQLGNSFLHDNKLYIYEVNNLPQDSCSIVRIDLDNPQLVCVSKRQLPMQLHHHTGQLLSQKDYLIFGGFGNERYNGNFLKLNIQNGTWDTLSVKGDKIHPRYFTSSFLDSSDHLYIFGGMGNPQGDNNLGRSYYYDLYQFDVNQQSVKKIWQLQWEERNKIPVRQLVYDGKRNFYSLMYSEYESSSSLQLYQFSLDKPTYQPLGDSIPIRSDKIKTNANLFQFEPLNRFYAVTEIYDNEEVRSEITIYRLRLPVLTASDWNSEQESKRISFLPWIIGCVILILGGLYWKWKRKIGNKAVLTPLSSYQIPNDRPANKPPSAELLLTNDFLFPSVNCVHLFGDFQVIDAKGVDITHLFKGKIKHLLILLLLHNPQKGIKSELLSSLLWPEKEHGAAKNIRGVTLNHLRKSLEYLNGIKLVYAQSYYKIELDGTYIDSYHFKSIMESNSISNELWTILSRGQFLSKESADGLDMLKSQMEQDICDFLMRQIQHAIVINELRMALQLIHFLYETDPTSTEALKIEINIWKRIGDMAKAKKAYQKFQKRYHKWMEVNYSVSFESLLDQD